MDSKSDMKNIIKEEIKGHSGQIKPQCVFPHSFWGPGTNSFCFKDCVLLFNSSLLQLSAVSEKPSDESQDAMLLPKWKWPI